MLDPIRSDTAAGSAESSTEPVARALATLTPSDLVRLKRLAQLRARLLPGLEWEELLSEALLRALDGSRRWPEGLPLLAFIAGIMRSLVDWRMHERRRLAERALAWSGTRVVAPPDAQLHARQCLFRGRLQVAIQKRVISPVLASGGRAAPPWFLRLFIRFPYLRRRKYCRM